MKVYKLQIKRQQKRIMMKRGGERGATGPQGEQGEQGPAGQDGEGVPTGGTTGQLLAKVSNTDFDTDWVDPASVSAVWGTITGDITDQTDLLVLLDDYQLEITPGSTAQYYRGDKTFQTLDTSVVPENGNLYYTPARFNTAFAAKSTSDLAEGSNLYLTNERVDDRVAALVQNGTGITWTYDDTANTLTPAVSLAPFSTTDLAEGANQYFTSERVDDRVASLLVQGTGITLTYDDTLNTLTVATTITQYTDEMAQDATASLIQNGTGISWSYSDALNTLTPTVSLSPFSTTNLTEGSNLYFTDERAQDAVGTILTDTSSIDFTYNDAGNTISAVVLPAGVDHNSLANLTTGDVHTQYALLAGRSGGQTLTGGTASGNNLTLLSTSNGTKGKILLGSASAYDEVNDRLGLGVTSPTAKLQFAAATTAAAGILFGTDVTLYRSAADMLMTDDDMTVNNLVVTTSGSLSNPSIRWSADTNTGLFYSASDNINLVSNGGTKLQINTTGISITGVCIGQGYRTALTTLTGATTLANTNHTAKCDATSGAFNVTLPAAAGNNGLVQVIKKIDASANAVTVIGTIDGVANYSLATQNKYVVVQSDNTAWIIIGNN